MFFVVPGLPLAAKCGGVVIGAAFVAVTATEAFNSSSVLLDSLLLRSKNGKAGSAFSFAFPFPFPFPFNRGGAGGDAGPSNPPPGKEEWHEAEDHLPTFPPPDAAGIEASGNVAGNDADPEVPGKLSSSSSSTPQSASINTVMQPSDNMIIIESVLAAAATATDDDVRSPVDDAAEGRGWDSCSQHHKGLHAAACEEQQLPFLTSDGLGAEAAVSNIRAVVGDHHHHLDPATGEDADATFMEAQSASSAVGNSSSGSSANERFRLLSWAFKGGGGGNPAKGTCECPVKGFSMSRVGSWIGMVCRAGIHHVRVATANTAVCIQNLLTLLAVGVGDLKKWIWDHRAILTKFLLAVIDFVLETPSFCKRYQMINRLLKKLLPLLRSEVRF